MLTLLVSHVPVCVCSILYGNLPVAISSIAVVLCGTFHHTNAVRGDWWHRVDMGACLLLVASSACSLWGSLAYKCCLLSVGVCFAINLCTVGFPDDKKRGWANIWDLKWHAAMHAFSAAGIICGLV